MIASVSWFDSTAAIGFWEAIEFASIIIVAFGVWGEFWAEHRKFPGKPEGLAEMFGGEQWKERREKWVKKWTRNFWRVLLFGLVIELVSFGFVMRLSGRQIESLRKANLELQAKLKPRIITFEQRDKFLSIVKEWPKSPVEVFIGIPTERNFPYARHIRQLLDAGGYGVTNESRGITTWSEAVIGFDLGNTNEESDVNILLFTTNKNLVWPGITFSIYSNRLFRNFDTDDVRAVPGMIDMALRACGITTEFIAATNSPLKAGQWGIFIPQTSR